MKLKKVLLTFTIILAFTACNARPVEVTEAITETTTAEETTATTDMPAGAFPPAPTETLIETTSETEAPREIKTVFSDGGTVFTIRSYSNDFLTDFNESYLANNSLPAYVKVNYVVTAENGQEYLRNTEADLLSNAEAEEPEKFDLIVGELYSITKLADPQYTVPLTKLGFTESELADQFPYTRTLTTSATGEQMGVMMGNNAELVIYRKSIARSVLGYDDPETVAASLSSLEKFDETAKKMKTAGYTMLGSYEETALMYFQSAKTPIVARDSNVITIPAAWKNWADSAKSYWGNGYAVKTGQWSSEWEAGMKFSSRVFSYIGPHWISEYSIGSKTDEKDDWDYCALPLPSYWGGTALYAANGTDNASLSADVMRFFSTDKDSMKWIATDKLQLTNSISVSNEIGDNSFPSMLGDTGYLPLTRFSDAAEKINIDSNSLSNYYILSESFSEAMEGYITGEVSYEEALEYFYNQAFENFPELIK